MKHVSAAAGLVSLLLLVGNLLPRHQEPSIPVPDCVKVLAQRDDITAADRRLVADFYRILALKVHGCEKVRDFVAVNVSFGRAYFEGSGIRGKYQGLAQQVDAVLLEAIGTKDPSADLDTEKLATYLLLISEAIRNGETK